MSTGEAFGRTIQLFLVDGKPTGLRKASIHGWTGVLFVSGASAFGDLTARDEVDRTGVYILSGPDLDTAGSTRVYIGSGNSVSDRIKQSALKRDFWETAITVTTSDDDMSKGHAEYLEARLIEQTAKAGRVTLDNGTHPDTSRRRLPEADIANMEQFLANLRIILPVIGLDMLKPQPKAVTHTAQPVEERTTGEVQFEIRHKSGVKATAVEEEGEFIVLEGSEVLTGTGYVQHDTATATKERLLAEGVLVPMEGTQEPAKMRFTRPWSFTSPSAAAAVVLDRHSNGRLEWKVKGASQSYHDWQQAQAAKQEAAE
ncbi:MULTISPECIES: GIY-YIG nuclease family protein [Marivita]|uniref:GIY-YIG nuclease family protein n=1 Tax=Marivita cryptomonadis TaxID=505252 RepID=A0A9Q2NXY0_9RHOB|nr:MULTISPECIES: GIY-YIG nuclease family protein [Marivita]MCR9168200.1 GIY-YIG nuclease family protein [Paracoccaceae bacterium]MBM2323035.1 GIY-YIG nuclease family protein [Marivita cryptomonadis]MBM2332618.1 GIY-YIG nuclease family protein [Marivita cryptomonadis]MBM2342201.1 GIY-YIG nuclease family protein [Marivita cryptomonadis]MBM2346866.1 GIY-YIG nuclease family protein [Marivita cryptomonadis]